jgi:hypothetical protein
MAGALALKNPPGRKPWDRAEELSGGTVYGDLSDCNVAWAVSVAVDSTAVGQWATVLNRPIVKVLQKREALPAAVARYAPDDDIVARLQAVPEHRCHGYSPNPPVHRGFNFTLDTFCCHKYRELIRLVARQGMNS